VSGDEQSVTNSGKLFHTRGPATANAQSLSDDRRVAEITIEPIKNLGACGAPWPQPRTATGLEV